MGYIYQRKDWPKLTWSHERLAGQLAAVRHFKETAAAGANYEKFTSGTNHLSVTALNLPAQKMNIDAKKLAKRLLWVNYWAWEECLFFHADPNPDNIIVGRDSTLSFINFAITDSLSRSKRQALHQILSYAGQRDPQNMARSALILMEPLPPLDLIELTQELETYNWQVVYA